MKIKLSKEANHYIGVTINRVAETNKVNREIKRKLSRLASRFNPDSDEVELKKEQAESVKKLLGMMVEVCDGLLKDESTDAERRELAEKRKEIFNEVNSRISSALDNTNA